MLHLITQYGFFAICLVVTLEEANVPLPIPGDLLLVYAGALAAHSASVFGLWLLLLTLIPTIGSYALYEVVRRGGRPLIERYGRYIHFGPEELAQSERLLNRYGVLGIAIGRSLPVIRHGVTIACGVLNTTRRDYLIGQLFGGFVNTLLFMALGALLGPSALEALHLPRLAVRLVEMLAIAVGLPALLWWLCSRVRNEPTTPATRRTLFWPLLLASAAGVAAMAATWAAAAAFVGLLGLQQQLNLTVGAAHWLSGRGLRPVTAYTVVVCGLLLGSAVLGLAYAFVLRPQVAVKPRALLQQAAILAALSGGCIALLIVIGMLAPNNQPFIAWWHTGSTRIVSTFGLGIVSYALTTVCGHSLAVAMAYGYRPWQQS